MSGICEGRVAIVTGAGRGIGRAHALELARQGAKVVVNDIGVALDGSETAEAPADAVVSEILAMGGQAVANKDDVADWEGAGRLVKTAIDTWGGVDIVVNNAGVIRDRMFVSAAEDEWDLVMSVHLKGHFCVARHAAAWWRQQVKAGETVDARIINTSSGAGLQGSIGQSAYSTAKGGIAALTLVQAAELGRYGVTANAIAPAARTRMTEVFFADAMKKPEEGFDAMDPANVAPLVAWLASPESRWISGRVFETQGGQIILSDGWRPAASIDKGSRWDAAELGEVVKGLVTESPEPMKVYGTK